MRRLSIPVLIGLLGLFAAPAHCVEAPAQPTYIPMAERPAVAVVSLDDGAIIREAWWGTNWKVGSGLSDILTTSMLEKNRFRVMERSLLDKAIAEQDLGASSRVDQRTAVKVGRIIGADYLIMGKVTQFAWTTRNTGGLGGWIGGLAGVRTSNTKANVAVDIRIVDAETAEILASFTGKGEDTRGNVQLTAGGRSVFGNIEFGSVDFMNTILGVASKKSIDNWICNFCEAIDAKKILLTPKNRIPVRPDGVVLNNDGSVIIANIGTEKGYLPNDKVEIHKKGKVLRDPDTGEILRVMTELIATGTITKIEEKTAEISFVVVEGGSVPKDGDAVKFVEAAKAP